MSRRTVSMEEFMKIATRRARTNATGQLRPLAERLSQAQLDNRQVKIWARRTVAEKIYARHNQFALVLQNFFSRGILGRAKWLFAGK